LHEGLSPRMLLCMCRRTRPNWTRGDDFLEGRVVVVAPALMIVVVVVLRTACDEFGFDDIMVRLAEVGQYSKFQKKSHSEYE